MKQIRLYIIVFWKFYPLQTKEVLDSGCSIPIDSKWVCVRRFIFVAFFWWMQVIIYSYWFYYCLYVFECIKWEKSMEFAVDGV